jgi:hypothetical protein
MKMRSMELSKKESEGSLPSLAKSDRPRYPYGLRISFENDTLKKLGLDTLPKVGSYVKLRAECCVVSVSSSEDEGGKPHRSMAIQIERLALDDEPETMEEAVSKGVREA